MKVYSQLKLPTLLAASLSCLMLAGCGVNSKPSLPSPSQNDGSTTDGKDDSNNDGKDGGKDDNQADKTEVLITVLASNINIPVYEDGTDKEECYGPGFGKKGDDEKCGALTYSVSADLDPILKVAENDPIEVTYTLSSPQGDISQILQDPNQKTGVIKLHKGYIQHNLIIPLKTDNQKTGNWQVTLTLSNPVNGAKFRDDQATVATAPREVIDPQASATTTPVSKPATAVQAANINDTGVTFTGNSPKGNETTTNCTSTMTSKQDCNLGRDAMYNDNSNGWAGFDFTKLDETGKELSVNASDWACVRDNATGKVWERKTYAPTIEGKYGFEGNANKDYRDAKWVYNYYDSKTGLGFEEEGYTTYKDDCGLNIIRADGERDDDCTTEHYAKVVNEKKLCGMTGWRLPNRNELFGIMNLSGITPQERLNADWFFSNNDNLPNGIWTNSVAVTYTNTIPKDYKSPKKYLFTEIWTINEAADFVAEDPSSSYSADAVLLVNDNE